MKQGFVVRLRNASRRQTGWGNKETIFGRYDMESVPHDLKVPEDFAGLYGLKLVPTSPDRFFSGDRAGALPHGKFNLVARFGLRFAYRARCELEHRVGG
jgi:hypothetical protein